MLDVLDAGLKEEWTKMEKQDKKNVKVLNSIYGVTFAYLFQNF